MNDQKLKTLICDLDGTLIDSSRGVLSALQRACETCEIKTVVPLSKHIVGPPLDEMLKLVTGLSDAGHLSRLRDAFIRFYDSGECVLVDPFPGIDDLLREVLERGYGLALATNKRQLPTIKILEAKGWFKLFKQVETVDSQVGQKQSKAQMIRNIQELYPKNCQFLYLGDTQWDFQAAQEVGIDCVLVTWGYQKPDLKLAAKQISDPEDVLSVLDCL